MRRRNDLLRKRAESKKNDMTSYRKSRVRTNRPSPASPNEPTFTSKKEFKARRKAALLTNEERPNTEVDIKVVSNTTNLKAFSREKNETYKKNQSPELNPLVLLASEKGKTLEKLDPKLDVVTPDKNPEIVEVNNEGKVKLKDSVFDGFKVSVL